MKKMKKVISLILALFMIAGCFTACGDFEDSSVTGADESDTAVSVLSLYEELQDNEDMPYILTEKAKTMLAENENLFLENKKDGLDALTDPDLEYKVLTKNIDKHGDKLIHLAQAYVLSIDETELDEETTFTEMHLLDENENSYYVFSLCAYDDIFEEDVVSVYALPLGETSFENVSGGTTLAILLAGCYVEKTEI